MDDQEPIPPPMPTESKVVATNRLKAEGRWADASLYRDERRVYWRSVDRRADAAEWSWREMVAEFPPLPPTESEAKPKAVAPAQARDIDPLDITAEPQDLIDRLAAVDPDWDRDVWWCYRVFCHPSVRLKDAPSLSAWGLLSIARGDPQKFLGTIEKVEARRAKPPATDRETPAPQPRETQDPGLDDLRRMIEDAS